MEFRLRDYKNADEEAAFAAWSEAVDDGGSFPRLPPAQRADFLRGWVEGATVTTVAERSGQVAGVSFVAPNFTGPCSHIAKAGYVVSKRHRRFGIGRALVVESMESARRSGFDALMFNLVMESNPSRLLYKDLGFDEIGRIPKAIGDQAAFIYWRQL